MRFDTPVYFQRITAGEYDPNTGDYGADQVQETRRYASVTDTGAEMLRLVYGELRQKSKTVRLPSPCSKPFDRLRIGDVCYAVDLVRTLRRRQVLIVSEVP